MTFVVGIDTSTTATKAIVVDESGVVVGTGISEYGYETPQALWSEQDPQLWWTATTEAIRMAIAGLDPAGIRAVGLTGQMHGLVLLDDHDNVLRPAILWNDQRTAAECDAIREAVGADRLVQITGNDALTGFTAPKLLWVREHEPEVYDKVARLTLPKDYVRLRLTGDHATDRAGGGGTHLFDLASRDWAEEILAALEIAPSLLPGTHEGSEITGSITPDAAAATGLMEGTPVVAGGGDQAASAVGTGAVDPGVVTVSVGTSGVVFAATDRPLFEPAGRVHAFPHAVPERWHLMGVMLSAAGSYRWFRDELAPQSSFEDLDTEAAAIPPGADGLFFLPYLTGERSPHPDPHARGAFVGLTVRHSRAHMTRSVLEGVAFGLADILDLMVAAGIDRPESVRISGGGARSRLWRQIIADVFDATVETVNSAEGAAYGASILAAVGADWFVDAQAACQAWIRVEESTEPSGAEYASHHQRYGSLYEALRPSWTPEAT